MKVKVVHFDKDQWEQTRVDGKRKLKRSAVPTLFSFTPEIRKRKRPINRVLQEQNILRNVSSSSADFSKMNIDNIKMELEGDSEFFPASYVEENAINIEVCGSIPVIKTEFSDNGLEKDPLHIKEEVRIPFVKVEIPSNNVEEKYVINIKEEPASPDNSKVNDKLICIKEEDNTLYKTECETECKLEAVKTEPDIDGVGNLHEMHIRFSEEENSSISGLTYPSEKSDVKQEDLCPFTSVKIEMKNGIMEEEWGLKKEESWLSCQDGGRQESYPYCDEADSVLNGKYNIADNHVSAVETHISYVRTQKHYTCEFCGYRACSNSRLVEHARKHTGETPYECNICTKRFKRRISVTHHMDMHRNPKKLLDEGTFKCLVCMEIFSRNSHLLRHMKTHEKNEYECETCHKKFSMLSSLAVHKLKHNIVEKLYECNVCKKFFSSPGKLSDHSVIHSTEEKPSTYQFQFINYVGSTAE